MIAKKIQNILIIRLDRFGDLLMNLPLIRRLKQNYPKAAISILCWENNKDLVSCIPEIDHIYTTPADKLNKLNRHIIKTFLELLPKRFDCIIIPQPTQFSHVTSFLLGARIRIGLDKKGPEFLTHRFPEREKKLHQHEIDFNLQLIDFICKKPWNEKINLEFKNPDKYQRTLDSLEIDRTKKRIAFHPAARNPEKQWPFEKYVEIIKELLKNENNQIIIVGNYKYKNIDAFSEFESFGNRVINRLNKTTLDELAFLLNNIDCLVSFDSGPFHLAWLQKTPVVGLFLKEAKDCNPDRWRVWNNYAPNRIIHKNSNDISSIEVLDAIHSLIGDSHSVTVTKK